jgi:tRNA modification GTPase
MKLRTGDTIVAIATPLGTGAISIVRMSGPEAIALADKAFRGNSTLSETPGYTIRHGRMVDGKNEAIDEVLVSVFRSPHSYTGEDGVEISCHGGSFITRKVLLSLIEAGARQADPGEFTKRAFLNGKMDLSQAEAVSDIISASSEMALRNSKAQMSGVFGAKLRLIRDEILRVCSLLELTLDFSDDEASIPSKDSIESALRSCVEEIESVIATYGAGKFLRDGTSVAIVGRPNVGKSSLFNALLMTNRSIVSRTAGTTRDFLEESVVVNGVLIRLFDTAGLRKSPDEIEAEGISRTKGIIDSSDVILLVVDSTQEDTSEEDLQALPVGKVLVVKNKIDIAVPLCLSSRIEFNVSAATGEGLLELRQGILEAVHLGSASLETGHFVSSSRHVEALRRCKKLILQSISSSISGLTAEFIAIDLRSAIDALSEITGDVTTDDILNEIFSSFCIGK